MTKPPHTLTFLGYGEAAQAFVTGFRQTGMAAAIRAYDIKTDGDQAAAKQAEYGQMDVKGCPTPDAACDGANAIFSLVTADQAEIAAQALRSNLDGAFFFDCNSCAPNTKVRCAQRIEAAGGRYVDVAVMTPVHPNLHKSPCLLAGPHAHAAQQALQSLGMVVQVAGDQVGAASTRKMIRSVMIKGLEALTLECFLAARKAGVDDDILASLEAGFPGFDWARRAPYMMERAATHGIRRAAEMEEVAKTLTDLGLAPLMTTGTVTRQRQIGALGLTLTPEDTQDLGAVSDQILAALSPHTDKT